MGEGYREEEAANEGVCPASDHSGGWSLVLQGLISFTKYTVHFIYFSRLKWIMIYFPAGTLSEITPKNNSPEGQGSWGIYTFIQPAVCVGRQASTVPRKAPGRR